MQTTSQTRTDLRSMNISNEFLERCKDITLKTPNDWKTSTQLLRIYECMASTQKSIKNGDEDKLIVDCCNLILSTIMMFDILHVSHSHMQRTLETCLQKMEKVGRESVDAVITCPPVMHKNGLAMCTLCGKDIEFTDKAVRHKDWYHDKCWSETNE